MKKFLVRSSLGNYAVYDKKLSQNFFSKKSTNIFYIIDKNVYKKNKIVRGIRKNFISIKANENSKSYKKISNIIAKLLRKKIKKDSEIYAIGGGIIQDISGFVASILFRGVKWNYIPTTILSQSDSCIGGKTSINFGNFKNQLGNFYPPRKIFLDVNFLNTLKIRDIKSGLGEMAHYYLVSNKNEWNFFKSKLKNVLKINFNMNIMKSLILRSLKIKKKFIEKDEFDTNHRLILNYGHTFGHAIEKISNYKIPHGTAVAHGINMSNFFSLQLKFINMNIFKEIETQMNKIVNLSKLRNINSNYFMEILKKDKKIKKNKIRLVLTKGYGKMFLKSFNNNAAVTNLLKKYFDYINRPS